MVANLYHCMASPLGDIHVTGNDDAIHTLYFTPLEGVAQLASGAESAIFQELESQLNSYFKGELESFTITMQSHGNAFQQKVWQALHSIPYGETVSYSDIAQQIGDSKATRAAASAIGKNPLSILVPCHRVIGKDGSLRGYAGGIQRKTWLLEHETAISRAD